MASWRSMTGREVGRLPARRPGLAGQVVDGPAELEQQLQAERDPPGQHPGSPEQSASAASAIVSSGSNMVLVDPAAGHQLGVAMAAWGVRAFTDTPWPSHSLAAATVRRLSAALVAPYGEPRLRRPVGRERRAGRQLGA